MTEFVIRVNIPSINFADIPFRARFLAEAIAMVEASYGKGAFGGVISQRYLG